MDPSRLPPRLEAFLSSIAANTHWRMPIGAPATTVPTATPNVEFNP